MLAFVGCGLLCSCVGCRQRVAESPAVNIAHQIAPWPPRVGTATINLQLSETGGQAVRGARVALEADMSHPGMRPEFSEAREMAAGGYQGQLTFTMAGDWVLLIRVTLAGGQTVERQLDVKGVRAK